MDMNKHIVKNDDNKPFHSNGYAQTAGGDRIGSVSSESFDKRRQTDANRRIIAGYRRSAIGSSYSAAQRAKSIVSENVARLGQNKDSGQSSLQNFNSGGQKTNLNIPPRRYNPYA